MVQLNLNHVIKRTKKIDQSKRVKYILKLTFATTMFETIYHIEIFDVSQSIKWWEGLSYHLKIMAK